MSLTESDPGETREGEDAGSSSGSAAATQPQKAPTEGDAEEGLANLGGVEITYQALEADEIPDDVKPNLAPRADDGRRMLLARNLVPLPPRVMALTLFCLMDDPNPAVRQAAEESFDDLPGNILQAIAGLDLPARVLDYMARSFYSEDDPDQILQALILNPATGTDTLLLLTRIAPPRILDLIAGNQTRFQRSPQIIFEFAKNPRSTIALLSRVLEFARRQKLITIDQENRLIDEFLGKIKPEEEEAPRIEGIVEEVVTEEGRVDWAFPSFMTMDFEADAGLDAEAEAIEQKIHAKLNMRDTIRALSVPQKLRLAVRGNMEARTILIEDHLALVSKAVLKNPRLTATEVERTSESRMIDPEILEELAKTASFTRTYAIRHALVRNPKTPLAISSKMMSTLFESDIKRISKNRNVSQAIQSIARQKIDAQEQRRKRHQKKKKN